MSIHRGREEYSPTHIAANDHNVAMALWRVEQRTLEQDLKDKEKVEARIYDLYKNNDLVRALIDKYVDNLVGKRVILQATPDYKTLGVTKVEAETWAQNVERRFQTWADNPENWISANQNSDFTGLCRHAATQEVIHGEILATREWKRTPVGFATCVQMVTPSRLKNPPSVDASASNATGGKLEPNPVDQNGNRKIFEGIEFDRYGASKRFWIEQPIRNDKATGLHLYNPATAQTQIRPVGKYTRFGWLQVWHIFEGLKPEYPRGISRLTSIIRKVKQLDRYSQADLDKAIISASYVLAITSDEDAASVADMLSGVDAHHAQSATMDVGGQPVPADLAARRDDLLNEFADRYTKIKSGSILHMFKGEKVEAVAPPVNHGDPANYRKGHERSVANTIGMSYEHASGDFSGVNFSGGQLSTGGFEQTLGIRRSQGVYKFAKLYYRSWLDEAISRGIIPKLGGRDYFPYREAYTRCEFTGTSRIYVDGVKRARENQLDLANGTTSRSAIVAEKGGDFNQLTAERAREAQIILEELENLAEQNGIVLSPQDKIRVLTEVLVTDSVELPPNIGEETPQDFSTEGL